MGRRFLVVATAVTLLLGVPTPSTFAASCPDAAGQQLPFPKAPSGDDVHFVGRGWGHGTGMSQYAARGGARLGCTAAQLLSTMFPGTSVRSDLPIPDHVRVGLYPAGPSGAGYADAVTSLEVKSLATGSVTWRIDGAAAGTMPANATWTITRAAGDGFTIAGTNAPGGVVGTASSVLSLSMGGNFSIQLPAKGRTYGFGRLELGASGSNKAWVTLHIGNLQRYLYGLAEVPASWDSDAREALRAQAIVARNYAVRAQSAGIRSSCECHLYDSTADQVYGGTGNQDARWTGAVDDTDDKLLAHKGDVAQTFYSSSHGGHSESSFFTFGGDIPYLQPVDVSAWEAAGDVPAHHAQWTVSIDPSELGALFGIGKVTNVQLPEPRGAEGRVGDPARGYGGVVLSSASESVTVSGSAFRSTLNLAGHVFRSTLFQLPVPSDPGVPITGDWDGNGVDDVGWYDDGDVTLRMGNGSVRTFRFGRAGDRPVVGDWDGDGVDTIGIIRDASWRLRNEHAGGTADVTFAFGEETDDPIVGNWDGDPGDEPGIRRGSTFRLRFDLSGGFADVIFKFGRGTDIPITGDFDADGVDEVGVVRDHVWRLRYEHAGGTADVTFLFARPNEGDIPITGDWDGDVRDTVGIVRGTSFRFKNVHAGGTADVILDFAP